MVEQVEPTALRLSNSVLQIARDPPVRLSSILLSIQWGKCKLVDR